jgi:hypothetical protein
MSRPPAAIGAIMAASDSASARLAGASDAAPPAASMARTVSRAPASPCAYPTNTCAPAPARRRAITAPMPRDAPVTSAR